MAFRLKLEDDPGKRLATWSKPIRNHVVEYLRVLSECPAKVSRPSFFPYPPGSMVFQPPPLILDGETHHFAILFRYAQDETHLQVIGIGHTVSDSQQKPPSLH
jgi:hypothetical protein